VGELVMKDLKGQFIEMTLPSILPKDEVMNEILQMSTHGFLCLAGTKA
jgi:hypothetical protein